MFENVHVISASKEVSASIITAKMTHHGHVIVRKYTWLSRGHYGPPNNNHETRSHHVIP